jgi:hypothetical protein
VISLKRHHVSRIDFNFLSHLQHHPCVGNCQQIFLTRGHGSPGFAEWSKSTCDSPPGRETSKSCIPNCVPPCFASLPNHELRRIATLPQCACLDDEIEAFCLTMVPADCSRSLFTFRPQ